MHRDAGEHDLSLDRDDEEENDDDDEESQNSDEEYMMSGVIAGSKPDLNVGRLPPAKRSRLNTDVSNSVKK